MVRVQELESIKFEHFNYDFKKSVLTSLEYSVKERISTVAFRRSSTASTPLMTINHPELVVKVGILKGAPLNCTVQVGSEGASRIFSKKFTFSYPS